MAAQGLKPEHGKGLDDDSVDPGVLPSCGACSDGVELAVVVIFNYTFLTQKVPHHRPKREKETLNMRPYRWIRIPGVAITAAPLAMLGVEEDEEGNGKHGGQ